jgi:hypothetical protein
MMKKKDIAEEYLKMIEREFTGLHKNVRRSVIEELRLHINEKSISLAKEVGKRKPDDEILHNVITDIGKPHEVASDYIKILTKEPDTGIKIFLYTQIIIGIFSMLISMMIISLIINEFSAELMSETLSYRYLIGEIFFSILFLILGFILFIFVFIQVKKSSFVRDYGIITSIISIILGINLIYTVTNFLGYRYMGAGEYASWSSFILGTLIIIFMAWFILGLGHLQKFQKLIIMEGTEKKKVMERISKRERVILFSFGFLCLFMIGLAAYLLVSQ